jgi:hypothetical protein
VTISAQVLIAEEIPADEIEDIKTEFTAIGLTVDLRVVSPKRSLEEVVWLVLAALPLQPFFRRLAEDFADDVHDRLRTFVNRILRRQPPAEGRKPVLLLQDTDSATRIILEPDLPVKSYQQLLSLDLTIVQRELLRYDMNSQQWRPDLDEDRDTPPRRGSPETDGSS